jgi:hypothetical protein
MTSRSKRIFGIIAKEMPGFVLCRDMLVIPPTEHILRGFLIEGTSEKGRIYLWGVVCPLHRPLRDPILNYSNQITRDKRDIYVDPKNSDEAAALIGSIISEHVDYPASIRTPKDFLRHSCSGITENSDFFPRYDLALTHCRLGNIRKGSGLLKNLRGWYDLWTQQFQQKYKDEFDDPIDYQMKQVERAIELGRDKVLALLDEWENKNVELLELEPTRVPLAAPPSSGKNKRRITS